MDGAVTVGVGTLYAAISGLLGTMVVGVIAIWRALQAATVRMETAQKDTLDRIIADKDAQITRERERADRWEAMYRASIERLEYSLDLGGAPQVTPPTDRRPRRPVGAA